MKKAIILFSLCLLGIVFLTACTAESQVSPSSTSPDLQALQKQNEQLKAENENLKLQASNTALKTQLAKDLVGEQIAAANAELGAVQTVQAAYMADHGNTAIASIGPATAEIKDYLNKPIKGTYTFDKGGSLIAATYPASGITFDKAKMGFISSLK